MMLRVYVFAFILLSLLEGSFGALVQLAGRQIRVNNQPFFGRGVAYGATPIGQWPDSKNASMSWDWYSSPDVYLRDLPLLQELNVNLIRTYQWRYAVSHKAFLDECFNRGIFVIVGYQWDWNQYNAGASGQQSMINDVTAMVQNCFTHPAVFGWAIGNELNGGGRGYNTAVWAFVKQLKDLVHSIEGTANWHPVGSPVADGSQIWNIIAGEPNSVDVWMLQIYRGQSFGNLWSTYSAASTKPMILTEIGVDSYCASNPSSGEYLQSVWDLSMWNEIQANMATVSGALFFSYLDGWYKCSGGSRTVQETCTYTNNAFPCTDVNEEYFGIVAFIPGPIAADGGDKIRVKPAFCNLKSAWKGYTRDVAWSATNISGCVDISKTVVYAEADSYVQGGANAAVNYGNASVLQLKYAASVGFLREVYLRFDLSNVNVPFNTAKLILHVNSIDAAVDFPLKIGTTSTTWGEMTINYNNKPTSTYVADVTLATGSSTLTIDVTSQASSATGSNPAKLSLRLYRDSGLDTLLQFDSRESVASVNWPRLELSIESSPQVPPNTPPDNVSTGSLFTPFFFLCLVLVFAMVL